MRLLHTSDWHLGRSFHRVGLLDAQAAFVDHLVETAVAEHVDVVVVSGDIFDRALAPVDAVALGSSALQRLLGAGLRVILTSGNHDSAPRLGFAAGLIDMAGVHLRTDPVGVGTPVVIPDDHGDVAIYGIPYLEPDLVATMWSLPRRSHQAALDEAMHRVRSDLATRAPGTRSVVLAHAFATGARPSDSERDISVGGVHSVAVETFGGVDYAALGHLHGRHALAPGVRYSGSPLAYSFSEKDHVKGSWLVELGPRGLGTVEFVEAPVPRPLAAISGTLDELLHDPTLVGCQQSWVQATVTDPQRPKRAMELLQQRFPHALVLSFEPSGRQDRDPAEVSRGAVGRTDAQVVADFFTDVAGRSITIPEADLMHRACDACRVSGDAAS
ncbi:MAG: exonuclease SbcCD subunit D [Actinomycetota bacterium]|nr:exonuclease SbcCD subunit D [Actinomycetota bacterium]